MNLRSNQPLVSMVIPSFNHGYFVKSCIKSIIVQDYNNIELIIIDDGSMDDSVKVIESILPECMARFARFEFRSRPNKGLIATLNEALEWSRGKYFSAIASDDLLLPNKTSLLLSNIEQEEDVAGVFGGCELIDQSGSVVGLLTSKASYHSYDEIITNRYVIVASSQLLRLDLIREVGVYPAGIYIEDWYMWLSLTKAGYRLKVLPDVVVKYRQHDSNISKNVEKMFNSRKLILSFFKDHRFYSFSMAQIHASAAIEFSCNSKFRSAGYLTQAFSYNKKILFSKSFLVGFIRLFLPGFFIRLLSRIKFFIRRKTV